MLLRWTARFIGPLTQRWLIWIGSLAGRRALRACGAIAVVRMPFQHWLVGVGFVVSLCTWAGDVKYIPNDQLSLGFASVDVHGFEKLPSVRGQFKRPAHLGALGSLLIRDKQLSIPARCDFLIAVVFRFLQLPPIDKESKLAVMVVRQIYFRILDQKGQ